MLLIRRLQAWCLFLMLVSSGTLAGAMLLIWFAARLGPLAPDPAGPHPMEWAVVGLVMASAGSGIAYVLLEFAARLLPVTRGLALRLLALVLHLPPRARVIWGIAALAATGLLLDVL